MSSLDFSQNQDLIPQHNVCVCCLVQNVTFIKLATCNHSEILDDLIKIKRHPLSLVCSLCHALIKKIQLFKRQVEESSVALTYQLPNIRSEQIKSEIKNKLNRSRTEIFHTINSEPGHINIVNDDKNANDCSDDSEKNEPSTEFAVEVLKIELEDSDFENDIPLSQFKDDTKPQKKKERKTSIKKVKNKAVPLQEKYEGRIKTVILSHEEMLAEREKDALKESYLKLPYKCESCIIGFDFELTLQDHIDKRHNKKENSYMCEVCKSVMSTESYLREHTKRHFRRYECEACGKRLSAQFSVVKHYDAHHAPISGRKYTCQECGFETENNRRFRYHKDKHRGQPQCAVCGNTFANSAALKTHMFTLHKQSARVYSCSPCGKVYNNKSGLYAHTVSAHADRVPYHCAPCQAHFRTAWNLRNHLRTHSNHVREQDKRFVCAECGEKFLRKSNLKEHIDWVHLKTSQHECTKCLKVFKNGTALKKHKSYVHDKKRPPRNKICDYCGRGFTTLSILATHVRTHTGERPLRCAHCSATFAHSAARHTHIKLLHRNAPA